MSLLGISLNQLGSTKPNNIAFMFSFTAVIFSSTFFQLSNFDSSKC